ncbi:MAG TPA: LysM peptidoglycan-binding domain-containing protein [Solirubrobacteraceae bacterium]|nr:LysM peptidoglycan-binding domain-containing protein [Solirubrobacteraceae bacterium]
MRRRCAPLALVLCTLTPAAAQAHVTHPVQPGETLSGIAALHGVSADDVASASGLPPGGAIMAGTELTVPEAGTIAPASDGASGVVGATGSEGPGPLGAYTVQPGDTLSSLAARTGTTVEAMAAMNGLDPSAALVSGTALKMPTGSPLAQGEPEPATAVVEGAVPEPVGGGVDAGQIADVAGLHGVPADLASAIAWQESGFNNGVVSSANARGVMQVLPGTWDWVQANLAERPLDSGSAVDNVHAGVLYLNRMLEMSGGDPATAAAGYYQGMASVQRIGMLPETQRYVANVLALRERFSGVASGDAGTGGDG